MDRWNPHTARAVTTPEEVYVATRRLDGTVRSPRTTWVVGVGDRVFVRSEKGRESSWYRWAVATGTGRLVTGGATHEVTFTEAAEVDLPGVDEAYRTKYGQHSAVVDRLQAADARSATLELRPVATTAPPGPRADGPGPIPVPELPDLDRLALVVVDVQRGFDDAAYWGRRNNPACEDNIAALLTEWRARGRPVVFARHDSTNPRSPLHPGQAGNALKAVVTGEPDLLVTKHVNSCFHGEPDLDVWLRSQDLLGFVVTGITTNHCCETTARVGANLGHVIVLALDATHTFDRLGPDGTTVSADDLARVTATNLHAEFATIALTQHLLDAPGVRAAHEVFGGGVPRERIPAIPPVR
jgi:nicotinamidase-related amidase